MIESLYLGHTMPIIGLGVYQNYHTKDSCLEAFKVGYRYTLSIRLVYLSRIDVVGMLTRHKRTKARPMLGQPLMKVTGSEKMSSSVSRFISCHIQPEV